MPIDVLALTTVNSTVAESLMTCVGPHITSLYRCVGSFVSAIPTATATSNSLGFNLPPASAFDNAIACVCDKAASDSFNAALTSCVTNSPYPVDAGKTANLFGSLYDSFCTNGQSQACKTEIQKALDLLPTLVTPELVQGVNKLNFTSVNSITTGITSQVQTITAPLCIEGRALVQNCLAPELAPFVNCPGDAKASVTVTKAATAGAAATTIAPSSIKSNAGTVAMSLALLVSAIFLA
ncbi:hypothetical protein BCR33DRAFT_720264 [Rhizoclosmatium globosum]|uniref:Uncharacterized protein n=1 Tax=Rhizoclosmatium globosum TaxID=329046 RepID=A0A1Y2BW67_9FUNG|nr:hypothetical protein BCR33DRAFT_720264 [Rhizoclosmatium globosum]|eukprot:ORY38996.1 hypothetical protein BCR33DRAFT_720264 [Rhizoclosmatium globosum]